MPSIIESAHGIVMSVHVVPNARETSMSVEADGGLLMRVAAPPFKGKANREIVKWLSKTLGKPSLHIRIVAGIRSNMKAIEIVGIDQRTLLELVRSPA